jgi:hypothetical protein
MDDSRIEVSRAGTTFVGSDATRLYAAVSLRSGLKLLKAGIKPNRAWSKTAALAAATRCTGKTYKLNAIDDAITDLSVWIETMKSALPVERRDAAV